MRDHEPDPADDAAITETAAAVISVAAAITASRSAPRLDAERARFLVAERQHVDAPAQEHSGTRPTAISGQDGEHVRRRTPARLPSSQNVMAGQLVVRVGEELEQRDAGAEQRADHDAGEHQHEQRIVAAHRGAIR